MAIIHGTVHGGRVVLDPPAALPDGMRVVVGPAGTVEDIGLPEEEWDDSPEGVAAWLAWYDTLQPLLFTPEEEAAWLKALADQKAFELATWEERCRKLEKLFE